MDLNKIINVKNKHEKDLFKKSNVISVGCGYKTKNGEKTNELGIIVGVSDKLPIAGLSSKDLMPQTLDGVPVDVIKTGIIRQHVDPKFKYRPAMPGSSVGHFQITAGTFGCVVKKDNKRYILSNNHVLGNSNEARIGDPIYQPGPYDGGTSLDKIGTLAEFVPIQFIGQTPTPPTCSIAKTIASLGNAFSSLLRRQHRLMAFSLNKQEVTNLVDCALCLPDNDADIIEEIIEIGKPTGIAVATLGMPIQKSGRTTNYTTGEITQINVTAQVSYGTGKTAIFTNQLMAGAMSAGGDSGSACLNMNKEVVGLLYAGSDTTTIFNRIQDVFDALNVTL